MFMVKFLIVDFTRIQLVIPGFLQYTLAKDHLQDYISNNLFSIIEDDLVNHMLQLQKKKMKAERPATLISVKRKREESSFLS